MKKNLLTLTMALSIMASMGTTAFASNDSITLSDETMVAITQNNLDLAKIQEQMNEVINPSLGDVLSQQVLMEEDGGYSISTTYVKSETNPLSKAVVRGWFTEEKEFIDAGGSVYFVATLEAEFKYDEIANTCELVTIKEPSISRDNGFTFSDIQKSYHNGSFPKQWASYRCEFKSTTSTGTTEVVLFNLE